MTTKIERLTRDLSRRLDAAANLKSATVGELDRRTVRAGHSRAGVLELGDAEIVLWSEAAGRLAADTWAKPGDVRVEVAQLLTAASHGHFGLHVSLVDDGAGGLKVVLQLLPDFDGVRILEVAWRMAGHTRRARPTPALCGVCYKPLEAKRTTKRYCDTKCRLRAAYLRKRERSAG